MKSFKEFLEEAQEHTSAGTSLNQVSKGLKYATQHNLIKPNSTNIDNGGGKYDKGKEHVESTIPGAKMHIHDPFNRPLEHNQEIVKNHTGKADYVGLHNVLNVIKEPEERLKTLEKTKSFMKPGGVAHITVYEGDKSGTGRVSKVSKSGDSSWQNHRPTHTYIPEVESVFSGDSHDIKRSGSNIIVRHREKVD